MPSVLYANDFGQLGGLMQNEVAREATLAEADRRARQQQAQFEAAQRAAAIQNLQTLALHNAQLKALEAQHADTLRLQERGLKLDEDYRKWLMQQPSKDTAKVDAQAENFALQKLVTDVNTDGSLDTESDAFKKAHPLVQQTLLAAAAEKQKEIKPRLDRRLAALNVANQVARMEQVAAGIEATPKPSVGLGEGDDETPTTPHRGLNFRVPDWLGGAKSNDPKAIAQDLKTKATELRAKNAKLLEEAGLTQDPKTKHFTTQFPDWYKEVVGRQLRMAAPPTAGTNMPTMPVRVRLSDGRILRTTSDKLPAVATRDPNAVLLQ